MEYKWIYTNAHAVAVEREKVNHVTCTKYWCMHYISKTKVVLQPSVGPYRGINSMRWTMLITSLEVSQHQRNTYNSCQKSLQSTLDEYLLGTLCWKKHVSKTYLVRIFARGHMLKETCPKNTSSKTSLARWTLMPSCLYDKIRAFLVYSY